MGLTKTKIKVEERRERSATFLRQQYHEIWRFIVIAVPSDQVPNTCLTYGKATATSTVSTEREKRRVLWYYYHAYRFHWTIYYSLHPTSIQYREREQVCWYSIIRTYTTPSYSITNKLHPNIYIYIYIYIYIEREREREREREIT